MNIKNGKNEKEEEMSFKEYLYIRKNIKEKEDILKSANLVTLVNKMCPIRYGIHHLCFYCRTIYIVNNIKNIYCSKDCKIMFEKFISVKDKLEVLKSYKNLVFHGS